MTRPAQTEADTVSYQPVLDFLISIGYQVSVPVLFSAAAIAAA